MAKRYFYNYQTVTRFSDAVRNHFFLLRCVPCSNECQQTEALDFFVHPTNNVINGTDAWGNPMQHGNCLDAHDHFIFVSSGEVKLEPYGMIARDEGEVFRVQSTLTAMSPAMTELAATVGNESPLATALLFAEAIYNTMVYTPGSTFMDTTASAAYAQRSGVCQDYAHILIAMCRERGIAARYVNGFIQGVGATHAWVEVLDRGRWWGVDPTNNRQIEYGYIKVAHGRDAHDCPVSRGVFTGMATQQSEIRVIMEEI